VLPPQLSLSSLYSLVSTLLSSPILPLSRNPHIYGSFSASRTMLKMITIYKQQGKKALEFASSLLLLLLKPPG
jgi:hypothetical protein